MPPVFGPTTWALILNPVSGRGAGLRDRARIEAALREQGLEFHSVVSRHAGHTIGLAAEAVSLGCRRIVVAGGDGSLGEAANGILGQDAVPPDAVHLGLIPLGTGNDWARMRSMPADYAAAARVLARGWTACQDVGVIEFPDGMRRHFVNVAGTGFDAAVLENMPSRRLPMWSVCCAPWLRIGRWRCAGAARLARVARMPSCCSRASAATAVAECTWHPWPATRTVGSIWC
jgi:diacylglycerol kinase family enzyme